MNTLIKADRAYRTIKAIELSGGNVIESGTYLYCEKIKYRSAVGQFAYMSGDDVMILNISLKMACTHLIFAKFIQLPERLRGRFAIRDDGTRANISKGKVYALTEELKMNGHVLAPGTPFLCLKGGTRPQLSVVRPDGVIDYCEINSLACLKLNEINPIEEMVALQSLVPTIVDATYQNLGERPVFSASIVLDGKTLIIERTSKYGATRYRELHEGAAASIIALLRQAVPATCTSVVLLESYVLYALFCKGAGNFAQVQAAIVRDIEKSIDSLKRRSADIANASSRLAGKTFVSQYNPRKGGFSYRRLSR